MNAGGIRTGRLPREYRDIEGEDMARVVVQGTDIVVRLTWREKVVARHRDVRVPVSALRRLYVEPDWWRALRGGRGRGTWIPARLCAGIRLLQEGQDFEWVRAGRPVLCVELRRGAPFSRLAISVSDPEETMRALLPLVPRDRPGRT
ncbi:MULTISPECIES: hypothetical protein [unclassified Streptomyces]|uniref:hypothetical protein n=1 Tax=unclassified Streptomyces TaxID=2593676 RepID=UPI002257DC91|nr:MULTISPECIES: hypothetical protein [unclassified Streptomyces]WSP58994.1 hypothetical protein OG306_34930 [Streptomyces sp. NBC_01241]WSU20487.1 hypothetical protein OG508_05400 [Streptomyces sp. NBC_01108]MCX4790726.1 hypothetical protein [Streptomyces sp. NBC_01221]MCX4793544.1 hypothetical protein [Streptomyces sp. NBC_01242]WSJ34973.1 hypothetical protein OG772_02075 [Streptomyces sp. NBC_01321]